MQTIRFSATVATNLSLGGMGYAANRVYQAKNRTTTELRVHRVLGRPFLSLERRAYRVRILQWSPLPRRRELALVVTSAPQARGRTRSGRSVWSVPARHTPPEDLVKTAQHPTSSGTIVRSVSHVYQAKNRTRIGRSAWAALGGLTPPSARVKNVTDSSTRSTVAAHHVQPDKNQTTWG